MISLMQILGNTSFILGAGALGYFTYIDYKKQEIENYPIFIFLALSLIWAWISPQFWLNLSLMAFLFVLALFLWNRGVLGGADVKILPGIIPFMGLTNGFANTMVSMWFFMILFLVIGTIYGLFAKYVVKSKEIPFLPAITLTYLVFWFYKLNGAF